MTENCDRVVIALESARSSLLELYEDFQALANQCGLKGKKLTKAAEKFSWNIRLIRGNLGGKEFLLFVIIGGPAFSGHADLLSQAKSTSQQSIKKICDSLADVPGSLDS